MRAQLKEFNDISIVYLSGRMNLDSAEEFQSICEQNLTTRKLIFCLEGKWHRLYMMRFLPNTHWAQSYR